MSKELKVRVVPNKGVLYELYFEGGGQLPESMSGCFTTKLAAQRRADTYVAPEPKAEKKATPKPKVEKKAKEEKVTKDEQKDS